MSLLAFDRAGMFTAAELDALKQAGAVAIPIYIVGNPGGMPHADKPYVDLVKSKGLAPVPNWERKADYLVSCGKAGGFAAGVEALTACRALGLPDDGTVAVFFSWDTFVGPSLYPQCGEVADGIIQGLGGHYLFSAYGQGGLIDYQVQTHRIEPGVKGWLSMSEGFPGFWVGSPPKPNFRNVAMVQEHHADGSWYSSPIAGTDVNTILDPTALHAAWPPNSPYGADMPLNTTTDPAIIQKAVWGDELHDVNPDGSPSSGDHPASQWLTSIRDVANAVAALRTDLDALQAQVAKLSIAGVDPEAVAKAVVPELIAHFGIQVVAK